MSVKILHFEAWKALRFVTVGSEPVQLNIQTTSPGFLCRFCSEFVHRVCHVCVCLFGLKAELFGARCRLQNCTSTLYLWTVSRREHAYENSDLEPAYGRGWSLQWKSKGSIHSDPLRQQVSVCQQFLSQNLVRTIG